MYRLLVNSDRRSSVLDAREFTCPREAARHAAQHRRARPDEHLPDALVLQRGTPAARLTFDPLRVVPGQRGGWSRTQWETIRVWPRGEWPVGEPEPIVPADADCAEPPVQAADLSAVDCVAAPVHAPDTVVSVQSAAATLQIDRNDHPTYKSYRWQVAGSLVCTLVVWFVALLLLMR